MPDAPGPPGRWSGTAVLADGGRVVHEESGGSADGPGSAPCGPRLRFQAGSIGKQVLSVVALALQERDRVHVAAPVTRWLPDLPGSFAGVTLHHLLTHTAGTGHWADLPGWSAGTAVPPTPDALRAWTLGAGPATAPGTSWRYSGPGFHLASLVLEAATGQRYRDLVADLVLAPAGMTSTTSGRFPAGWARAAAGHRGGRRVRVDPGWTRIPGSGDLWTTAEDLLRYARALRSGRLLDPSTAAAVWEPHVRSPAGGQGVTAVTAYGYGTFLGRVLDRPAWFVPGDNPGYRSLLAHPRGGDTDLVVLSNDEGPGLDAAAGRVRWP